MDAFKQEKQMLENAVVGQEVRWFGGWTYETGTVVAVYKTKYSNGKNDELAIQCGNSCQIINTNGVTQQTVIGGTLADIIRHNRVWTALEQAANDNANETN